MNYELNYYFKDNNFQSNEYLYIYDFGHVKGFLYNNEFKLFKILNKDYKENLYKEKCISEEQIPLKALSIEKYNCIFENNMYKTPNFIIEVCSYFKPPQPSYSSHSQTLSFQPSLPSPLPPSLPLPLPASLPSPLPPRKPLVHQPFQPLYKKPIHKRINLIKNEAHPSQVNEKTLQAPVFQQVLPSLPKNQWLSLEQIMKHSLPSVHQQPSSQQIQVNQSSQILKQKFYQHLRQPQKQSQKASQVIKSQDSSLN